MINSQVYYIHKYMSLYMSILITIIAYKLKLLLIITENTVFFSLQTYMDDL